VANGTVLGPKALPGSFLPREAAPRVAMTRSWHESRSGFVVQGGHAQAEANCDGAVTARPWRSAGEGRRGYHGLHCRWL